MTTPRLDAGSFRDRDGRVFYHQERVLRTLSASALDAWRALEAAPFFARAQEAGTIVRTNEAEDAPELVAALGGNGTAAWKGVLEHARVPFVSYPYEWCFGMLRDAAALTLDLLSDALESGLVLKDASAYNVLFDGARPVFIDVASFEPWQVGRPWVGYRQFCQLFLYPLEITAFRDVDFQPFLRGSLEGIEPMAMRALLRPRDRLRSGVMIDVDLHSRLEAGTSAGDRAVRTDIEKAGFKKEMIASNVKRLRKVVGGLRFKRSASEWADYAEDNSYDETDHQTKRRFVDSAVGAAHRRLVIDLGANTGTFSRIAAAHADQVVAIDVDHLAIERLYHRLRKDGPNNVLPLVGNLADPSPGLGWRGLERKSLEARADADVVLALALIHHLVITANVPLDEVIDLFATLGREVVVEWVSKDDPMVKRLLRNKDDQYADYDQAVLEASLDRHFAAIDRQPLESGTRVLYHARERRDG